MNVYIIHLPISFNEGADKNKEKWIHLKLKTSLASQEKEQFITLLSMAKELTRLTF